MEDLSCEAYPGMHRYAPVRGMPMLLEAIASRVTRRSGLSTSPDNVLVSAGATGGLSTVVGTLVAPGEDVLILAPFWPLIAGIVSTFHGTPIPVPFFDRVQTASDVLGILKEAITPKTVAIYLNSPNNPTGKVLPHAFVEEVVKFAQIHDLWVFSDEVYEDYVYRGVHVATGSFDQDRVLSTYSCSKAFGMAGNRCGYVVGASDVIGQLSKISTHTFYSTPTASQIAATRVLQGPGDDWIGRMKPQYQQAGDMAARTLNVPPPEGSTFLFMDIEEALAGRSLDAFLEGCANLGLLVAPGPIFGPYPTCIRVCFTAAPPDVTQRGIKLLAELLTR